MIHSVLWAMGTRYVGKNPNVPKIDAAVHNFNALVNAGGPHEFFKRVAGLKGRKAKFDFLEKKLHYYKKKGCRDTLIELRLARDCMALDQRIKNILAGVGVKFRGSIDRHFEQIEKELIERVAKPTGMSGGELDRVLFQNYGDIMVRLRCR